MNTFGEQTEVRHSSQRLLIGQIPLGTAMHAPSMSQLEDLATRSGLCAWVVRRARCCEAVAKDLIQDACVVACEHGNFSAGYFFGIVRNKVREHVRKAQRVTGLGPEHEYLAKDPWTETELERQDSALRDGLHIELARLPEDERDCLYQAYVHDIDQAKLAAARGLSHAAIRQRLRRTRERLRKSLLPLVVAGIAALLTLAGLYEVDRSIHVAPSSEIAPASPSLVAPFARDEPKNAPWTDGKMVSEGLPHQESTDAGPDDDGMGTDSDQDLAPSTTCSGAVCTLPKLIWRRWIRTSASDLESDRLGREPRVALVKKNGRTVGAKLTAVPRGSFPDRIGLAPEDVITHFNGQALEGLIAEVPIFPSNPLNDRVDLASSGIHELRDRIASLTDKELDGLLKAQFRVSTRTGKPIPRIAITFKRHGQEFKKVIWFR